MTTDSGALIISKYSYCRNMINNLNRSAITGSDITSACRDMTQIKSETQQVHRQWKGSEEHRNSIVQLLKKCQSLRIVESEI